MASYTPCSDSENAEREMVTTILFDCEFTDLSDSASLISAGFISQSGDQFYVELSDYDQESCSDFVKTSVLPLISNPSTRMTDFISSLTDWVSNFGDEILLIADSDWDQKILTKTFASTNIALPENWQFQKAPDNFINGMQRRMFYEELGAYFLRHPDLKPHHALTDAFAIRNAYLRANEEYAIDAIDFSSSSIANQSYTK